MSRENLPMCWRCSCPVVAGAEACGDCEEFIRVVTPHPVHNASRPDLPEEARLQRLIECTAEACRELLQAHGGGTCPCGFCHQASALELVLGRLEAFLKSALRAKNKPTSS